MDIKTALETIEPSPDAKRRMLVEIQNSEHRKTTEKSRSTMRFVTVAACFLLLCSVAGGSIVLNLQHRNADSPGKTPKATPNATASTGVPDALPEQYDDVAITKTIAALEADFPGIASWVLNGCSLFDITIDSQTGRVFVEEQHRIDVAGGMMTIDYNKTEDLVIDPDPGPDGTTVYRYTLNNTLINACHKLTGKFALADYVRDGVKYKTVFPGERYLVFAQTHPKELDPNRFTVSWGGMMRINDDGTLAAVDPSYSVALMAWDGKTVAELQAAVNALMARPEVIALNVEQNAATDIEDIRGLTVDPAPFVPSDETKEMVGASGGYMFGTIETLPAWTQFVAVVRVEGFENILQDDVEEFTPQHAIVRTLAAIGDAPERFTVYQTDWAKNRRNYLREGGVYVLPMQQNEYGWFYITAEQFFVLEVNNNGLVWSRAADKANQVFDGKPLTDVWAVLSESKPRD